MFYLFIKLFFINLYLTLSFYPSFFKIKAFYYFIQLRLYFKLLYKTVWGYYSIYYRIRSNFFKKIFKLNFRIIKRLILLTKYAQKKLKRFNLRIPDAVQRRQGILKFFYHFILQSQFAIANIIRLGNPFSFFTFLHTFFRVRAWGLYFLFIIFKKRVQDKLLSFKLRISKSRRKDLNISNINISSSLLNKFFYAHALLDEGVISDKSDPFQVFNGKHPAYIQNYVALSFTISKQLKVDTEKISVIPFGSDLLDFDYYPEADNFYIYLFNFYEFDILDRDLGSMKKRFLYWLDFNYYLGNDRRAVHTQFTMKTRSLLRDLEKSKKFSGDKDIALLKTAKDPISITFPFNKSRNDRTRYANPYSKFLTGSSTALWVTLIMLALTFFIFYYFKLHHEQHLWGIANTRFRQAFGINYTDLSHWPHTTRYNVEYDYFPFALQEWYNQNWYYISYIYWYHFWYDRGEALVGVLISLTKWLFMYTRGFVPIRFYLFEGLTKSINVDYPELKLAQDVFLPSYKYFENPFGFVQLRSNLLVYLDIPVTSYNHSYLFFAIEDKFTNFITSHSLLDWLFFFLILSIPGLLYLLRARVFPMFGFFTYEAVFFNMQLYLPLFTRFYYYAESNSPLARVLASFDKRKNYYSYLYFLTFARVKDKKFLKLFYENIYPFTQDFLAFKFNYLASLREKFSSTIDEKRLISQNYTNYWMWWLPSIEKDTYSEYAGDFLEAETDDEFDEGGAEYLENEEIMKLKDLSYQIAPIQATVSFTRFIHKWNIRLFMCYSKTWSKGSTMFVQDFEAQQKEFVWELNNEQRALWTKYSDLSSSLFMQWYQKEFIELYLKQMSLFHVAENEIHHKFKYYYKNLIKRNVNLHSGSVLNLSRIAFRSVNLPHMLFDDPWNEDQSVSMIHYYDSSYFQKRIGESEAILKAFSFYLFYRQRIFRKLRAYRRYFDAQQEAVMDPTNFKHTKVAIYEYRRYKGFYDLYKLRLFNTVADATARWDEYELESYYDHEQPLSNWFENALIAKIGVEEPTLSEEIPLDSFIPDIRSTLESTLSLVDVNQFYWSHDNYTTYLSTVEDSNENTQYLNFSEGVPYLVYVLNGYFATKQFSMFSEQEYILDTPLPEDVTHSIAEAGAPHPMYLMHSMSLLSSTSGLPLKLNPGYPHEAQLFKKYRNNLNIPHEVVDRWSVPQEKKYMYKLSTNWRTFINIFEAQYVNPAIGDYETLWMHEEDIWVFYPDGYAWDSLM